MLGRARVEVNDLNNVGYRRRGIGAGASVAQL